MDLLTSIKTKLLQASGQSLSNLNDKEKHYLVNSIVDTSAKADELEDAIEETETELDDKIDAITFPDVTEDTEALLPTKYLGEDVYEALIDASDLTESSGVYTAAVSLIDATYVVIHAEAIAASDAGYSPAVAILTNGEWTFEALGSITPAYFLVRYTRKDNELVSISDGTTTYTEGDYLGPSADGNTAVSFTINFLGAAPEPAEDNMEVFFDEDGEPIGAVNGSFTASGTTWTGSLEWSSDTAPALFQVTDSDGNTYGMTLSTEDPNAVTG